MKNFSGVVGVVGAAQSCLESAVPAALLIVRDHVRDRLRAAHDDEQLLRARNAGIEDISGEKTARQAVGQSENDRVELTALRFMYRDRVGKLKLVQHIECVGRKAVIEAHDQAFLLRIDALELAHVSVANGG